MRARSCFYGVVCACQALSILLRTQFDPMQRGGGWGLHFAVFLDHPGGVASGPPSQAAHLPSFLPVTFYPPHPHQHTFSLAKVTPICFPSVSFSSYAIPTPPTPKLFLAAPSVPIVLASAKTGPGVSSLDPSISLPPSTLTLHNNWFHNELSHQTGSF